MPMGLTPTREKENEEENSTLSEGSKIFIDNFMEPIIQRNQFAPLKKIMLCLENDIVCI